MSRISVGFWGLRRMLAIVCVTTLLLAPGVGLASAQGAPVSASPLDLSALLLYPADLERAGLGSNWGLDTGRSYRTVNAAISAPILSDGLGDIALQAVPGASQLLQNAGFLRVQDLTLAVPRQDAPNKYAQEVDSGAMAFNTADGAVTAWDTLTTDDNLSAMLGIGFTSVPAPAVGDEAKMFSVQVPSVNGNSPYATLTEWARTGRFIAGVSITDYTDQKPPRQSDLESLTQTLVARLAAAAPTSTSCLARLQSLEAVHPLLARQLEPAADAVAPGISTCVLRFDSSVPGFLPAFDAYTLIDGNEIPWMGDTGAAVAEREARDASEGRMTGYQVGVTFPSGSSTMRSDSWIDVFSDPAGVQADLDNTGTRLQDQGLQVTMAQAPAIGDGAVAYTAVDPDSGAVAVAVYARVGNVFVGTRLSGPPEMTLPSIDTVAGIVEAQVACLNQTGCLDPYPIPAALLGT